MIGLEEVDEGALLPVGERGLDSNMLERVSVVDLNVFSVLGGFEHAGGSLGCVRPLLNFANSLAAACADASSQQSFSHA